MPGTAGGPRRRKPGVVGMGEVIGWFAGVVCTYWLYWLIAVPLIEPGVEPEMVTRASEQQLRAAREAPSARKQALAQYFPPGSWELDNPAIWETDQTLLLFKSPTPRPDGTVDLEHCTLLFFPRAREEQESAPVRPVVMRASEGAQLKFDQPIVLKTVDLAKRQLVGGRLKGLITIEREPSKPGARDQLLITTRDVELVGDRAFSPHPVKFRFGESYGSGRDLEIQLASDAGRPGGGFRSGKVKTLLLKRDVVMYLALDDPALARRTRTPGQPAEPARDGSTLKITCQSAFEYDFNLHAASFHDAVNVMRLANGPGDQLNCELLSVFFEHGTPKPAGDAPQVPAARPASDVPIKRIEARGDPVVLQSPSRGVYVSCHRGLDFHPLPGNPFGRLVASGTGVMRGVVGGKSPGNYQIQWTRELHFEPAEGGQYVAALKGGATVRVPEMGEITAHDRTDAAGRIVEEGAIFAWATPLPQPPQAAPPGSNGAPAPGEAKWQIERVLAQGVVIVDVPQLNATTRKLEVWIERPQVAAAAPGAAGQPPNPLAQPAPPRGGQAQRKTPSQRFTVNAGGVQVKLVPNGEEFAVTDLTLSNQAHLQEITQQVDRRGLVVAGEKLHVAGAHTEQTRVTVSGKPAHISAGGMELFGETIDLEKHTNRLWVAGPGRMTMPIAQDLQGRPLARPQNAEVVWLGGMNFQTNRVIFERQVRVISPPQQLTTERLEGVLDRPIDFANPRAAAPPGGPANPQDAPQLDSVRCYGLTVLDSRATDAAGQTTSVDTMQVHDLEMHRASGDIRGRGPGWVRHVGRSTGEGGLGGLALPGQQRPAQQPAGPRPGLIYLFVDSWTTLEGNANRREITFGGSTKTVYAPVMDWNSRPNGDEPASLGPEGIVLDAQTLTVREMPSRVRGQRGWFELVARGNVLTEGAQFVAVAHQATYSQDKDQLVLEGDGTSPAEISYTAVAGGPRRETRVDKIIYAVTQRSVVFSGAHSMSIDLPQAQRKTGDEQPPMQPPPPQLPPPPGS